MESDNVFALKKILELLSDKSVLNRVEYENIIEVILDYAIDKNDKEIYEGDILTNVQYNKHNIIYITHGSVV